MNPEEASLFAEGMVEYVIVTKTVEGLTDYWIKNQAGLDCLKAYYPADFERVLKVFRDRKAEFLNQGEQK